MSADFSAGASPTDLVPGDPDAVDGLANTLGMLARGMGEGAAKLNAIHSGDWIGDGGSAFRGLIGTQPGKFGAASDAFGQARSALIGYATVLRQAQHDAGLAITQYGNGQRATDGWRARVRTDALRRNVPAPVARDPSGHDPGAADRTAASRALADARDRVDKAARQAATTLAHAESGAPKKPGIVHRALSGVTHLALGGASFGRALIHFGEGVADSVADMGKGIWALTGALCTDPGKFVRSWEGLLAVGGLTRQRRAFAQSFVDWNEWSTDPARALGHTTVNVGTTVLGGSGAISKAGDLAELAPTAAELTPEMLAVTKATEAAPATLQGFPAWRGLTDQANWAQKKYGAMFSENGPLKLRTVEAVAMEIKDGALTPASLPIDIIKRGDSILILNTRSSHALIKAGIPRSQWIVRDVSGDPRSEGRLDGQLRGSKLNEDGLDSVRPSLKGPPDEAPPVPSPYNQSPAGPPFDWRKLGLGGPIADHAGSGHGGG